MSRIFHTLSTPFACVLHFFCRLFGVNSSAYQYMILLSFLFYHKFLKKSSLFATPLREITKIQKFTHNSFLFTHFRHLSAPCIENTLLFGGDSKHLKVFCCRLKAQFYKLVLIIHYNNSAYSVLKRFAATFSGNSITLFLFNFDLSVSAHPLFVFVLPMEHKP